MPHWLQLMLDSLPTLLWAGVKFTIPLTLLSFAFGLSLGLLTAVTRLFAAKPLVLVARFYVWVIRGTPLLVQIFLIYYGLGQFRPSLQALGLWGLFREPYWCAILALTLNTAAYGSEILRGAIKNVPRGLGDHRRLDLVQIREQSQRRPLCF